MPLKEDKSIDYEFLDLIYENLEGQRLKIKKYIIHPKYINAFQEYSFEYDIAILITEKNIGKFSNFFKILYPTHYFNHYIIIFFKNFN